MNLDKIGQAIELIQHEIAMNPPHTIETHLSSTPDGELSTSLTDIHIASKTGLHTMPDEALAHALSYLRGKGYDITDLPATVTTAPAGSWWVSEPGEENYDWMAERDLVEMAEALEFSRTCAFCGLPAESKCPDCGVWTCYEDRRDFSPDFDDHRCPPCVGKRNLAMIGQWREMAVRGEVLNEKQQYWVDR